MEICHLRDILSGHGYWIYYMLLLNWNNYCLLFVVFWMIEKLTTDCFTKTVVPQFLLSLIFE